jgi:pilus assembly protein Flp/PilA
LSHCTVVNTQGHKRRPLSANGFTQVSAHEHNPQIINDEPGATAIEYGLIGAGIAITVITAANGVGTKLKTNFGTISTSLK